jgi:hypothetical protein
MSMSLETFIKLSRYFHQNDKFDLIFSSAVFEHLHMPWVAAVEIQKMLKVGGYVFIETHFSFSSHERPWHFFQFSDMGLRALFNGALGFDLIDSGMSNPIAGYFSRGATKSLRYSPVTELYCHSEILCRKRCEVDGFEWSEVGIDEIVEGTRYPMPQTNKSSADVMRAFIPQCRPRAAAPHQIQTADAGAMGCGRRSVSTRRWICAVRRRCRRFGEVRVSFIPRQPTPKFIQHSLFADEPWIEMKHEEHYAA